MKLRNFASAPSKKYWRTLLVLGRTSNLPTVWSNCLAGWLLGDGDSISRLCWVLVGASLLYVGGMFLNDAFDEEFDRRHRPERPIPSQAILPREVWVYGVIWILLGLFCLVWISPSTAIFSLCLVVSILLYDAVHKLITFAPVLMSACRFFLYLVAASAGRPGLTGLALWSSIVLAAYIIGLSYLARQESKRGVFSVWPCALMALPVVLGWFVNGPEYRARYYLFSAILAVWVVRSLTHTLWSASRNVGRSVSGLLAGIVLVDLVAVAGGPGSWLWLLFFFLFAAALVFQRFIPAT